MILSEILLLLLNKADNVQGRLPGKLYEYLRSKTPILALGPEHTDVAAILEDTRTGSCIDYDDHDALYTHITALFEAYIKLEAERKALDENIEKFDVRNQTRELAEMLTGIVHE